MDKKRNIFDREMSLYMNSKKCSLTALTSSKNKNRDVDEMEKINWSIWVFLLIMFSFF